MITGSERNRLLKTNISR